MNAMLSSLSSEGLRLQLIRANWPITETEYTLIRLGIASFGLALGSLLSGSILPGIGLAIIAFFVPVLFLRRRINQRQLAFARQLVDTLLLVNGGIRAGYSLLQALDIVIDEMKAPTSEEFYRVRREVGLGLPLTQALENLGVRMENDDLNLVIAAININTQVGGSLSTMLQAVTNTIRERVRLFSEVRALTAQNRNSGTILTFLPIVVGGVLFVLNPSYMARLFEPGWILCVPAGALFGILLGNIIIRRMAKIDY
jgi:tight adherence protein B